MTNPTDLLSAASRLLDPNAPRREDDVRLVAEAWRELLGQVPDRRAWADGKVIALSRSLGGAFLLPDTARSIAAQLLRTAHEAEVRACAEVDARAATPEKP